MFSGTYKPNRRPTITTSPDCLVYLNGELSLPNGSHPNRRVNIQPFIHTVTTSVSTQGNGQAGIELHVPHHTLQGLYSGGQLILTTMMEVQIYMKGHFTVGGAPQYYPVFWGIVTSVSESYGGGENSISLSCQDILHWWEIQQISHNPSWMDSQADQQKKFNLTGSIFTQKNPFNIMYTLARQVYGDSMNMRDMSLSHQDFRSGLRPEEQRRLMAYWSLRWGRIATSLRMYGPSGDILQGDQLDYAIDPARFLVGKSGAAAKLTPKFLAPFKQGEINFADISPFSRIYGQTDVNITSSDFDTKMNIANQVKEAIGYEFFMDSTGELVFKPPFYNLDVRPNFPVSWIKDVDVVSWSFSENPPDVTFVEATGFMFANMGVASNVPPKATYVDYRLVQKYGWRPGSFSSEFVGSREYGSQKALFYHLVDIMDRQNARVNNGSATIPLRPELKVGYPVYVEGKDAYYYVEGIQHTFSYGGRCTTNLTLMSRRQKFYGDFGRWENESQEPKPGDIADPGTVPQNIYKRAIDPASGTPQGDRNVVMRYVPTEEEKYPVETFKGELEDDSSDKILNLLVSNRSQFGLQGPNKYMLMVDPNRDTKKGVYTQIKSEVYKDGDQVVNAAVFPVSDERGYEVFGTYEYGRKVTVGGDAFLFDRKEEDVVAAALLYLKPLIAVEGTITPDVDGENIDRVATANSVDVGKDSNFLVNPNNYGRLLSDIRPPDMGAGDLTAASINEGERFKSAFPATVQRSISASPVLPSGSLENHGVTSSGVSATSRGKRDGTKGVTFRQNSNVSRWRQYVISVREKLEANPRFKGRINAETFPDAAVLAFIHVESGGNPAAVNGRHKGLLQVSPNNALDTGRKNTDLLGGTEEGIESIQHYMEYMDRYRYKHKYDPVLMAICWKNGPGSLDQYNVKVSQGASQQELDDWLYARANGEEYVSRKIAALTVWDQSLLPASAMTQKTPEANTGAPALISDGVKPEMANSDEALDPSVNHINDLNEFALEINNARDLTDQVSYFEDRLSENQKGGIAALPADFKPPRDPSVGPIITDFLRDLYDKAFDEGYQRERELRGETRYIPRLPDLSSVPTITPSTKNFVNTPLARNEVQEALDRGETPSSLFREEGAVKKIQDDVKDISTALSTLGDDK